LKTSQFLVFIFVECTTTSGQHSEFHI